jgi:hypothetical protein
MSLPFADAIHGTTMELRLPHLRESTKVRIPPGIEDGGRIRIPGKGEPGHGGPPGDAYVNVRVEPHPLFTREGSDLYVDVPVGIATATLGGEVEVPTLDGRATIKIPPGTPQRAEAPAEGARGPVARQPSGGKPERGRADRDAEVDRRALEGDPRGVPSLEPRRLAPVLHLVHPALVHFTVAFLVAGALLESWGLLRRRPAVARWGGGLTIAGTVAVVPTIAAGYLAANSLTVADDAQRLLDRHESVGLMLSVSRWCSCSSVRGCGGASRRARASFALGLLALAGLAGFAAF